MPRLKGYRFPREIVAYMVWVYHRFALGVCSGWGQNDTLRRLGCGYPTSLISL